VFSTAQNTQSASQSWVEKRRGREEKRRPGGEKGEPKVGESNQASNHTPK